jgi:hypothetical protein
VFNAAVVLGLLLSAACDDKADPKKASGVQYGDPVGLEIGAHASVPALDVKVAVTKGRDPTPSVSSLAAAVYAAATACPAFVTAVSDGKTTRIELSARNGAFRALGAAADELGTACMSQALDGKKADMDKPDPLDVIVELSLGKAGAASR